MYGEMFDIQSECTINALLNIFWFQVLQVYLF